LFCWQTVHRKRRSQTATLIFATKFKPHIEFIQTEIFQGQSIPRSQKENKLSKKNQMFVNKLITAISKSRGLHQLCTEKKAF
jgi:hypothetical protein